MKFSILGFFAYSTLVFAMPTKKRQVDITDCVTALETTFSDVPACASISGGDVGDDLTGAVTCLCTIQADGLAAPTACADLSDLTGLPIPTDACTALGI